MIERFNRTCHMMLSMFVNDWRDNWPELLPYVMHAYITSFHESTNYSPYRLMMGEECSLSQDVSTAELRAFPIKNREQDIAPHLFATWVRDALEVSYDHVRETLCRTAARRKRLYDTQVSDVTSTPSIDVSDWGDLASHHSSQTAVGDLDRPIDLSGHVLSPFFIRNMDYMDSRFHSIAHLMCYRYADRYAVANNQRTFATGIRKWAKHLVDFPTPKFVTGDKIQQWREILIDIYSHLCMTDESFKAALIDTGPRPFSLQCAQPWGYVPIAPDTSALHHTAPRADVISDILIQVRVDAVSNTA